MHPILVRIPLPGWKFLGDFTSIPIHSYGVMLGLSLVVGWYLTLGLAEKDGLPKETMANCYVFTALVGGDHVARPLLRDESRRVQVVLGDCSRSGAAGSLRTAGSWGASWGRSIYLRREKVPLWPWADVAAPSLASGLMLTRIGCYLFGCDFGKPLPSSSPEWLKKIGTFPHWSEGTLPRGSGSPAWMQHVQQHLLDFDAPGLFAGAPDADLRVAGGRPSPPFALRGAQEPEVPRAGVSDVHFRLRRAAVSLGDDPRRLRARRIRSAHRRAHHDRRRSLGLRARLRLLHGAERERSDDAQDDAGHCAGSGRGGVPPFASGVVRRKRTCCSLDVAMGGAVHAVPAAMAYGVYFKAAEAHPEKRPGHRFDLYQRAHPQAGRRGGRHEARAPEAPKSKARKAKRRRHDRRRRPTKTTARKRARSTGDASHLSTDENSAGRIAGFRGAQAAAAAYLCCAMLPASHEYTRFSVIAPCFKKN